MTQLTKTIQYTWHSFRRDQFWLPAAFLAFFMLMNIFFNGDDKAYNLAISYLGVALPLIAGIMAAYAVLEDPVLELQFTSPLSAGRFLLQKLGLLLGVMALCAVAFQLFLMIVNVSLQPLGGLLERQLAWLLPVLTAMMLSNLFALLLRHSTGGAAIVGLLWIMQVMLRGMFATHEIHRCYFLFMSALYPLNEFVVGNRLWLAGISLAAFVLGVLLLKKQERYL